MMLWKYRAEPFTFKQCQDSMTSNISTSNMDGNSCSGKRIAVTRKSSTERYTVTVQNTLPSTKMANSQTKEISCQCSYSMDVMV